MHGARFRPNQAGSDLIGTSQATPPITAPAIGATQNIHNCTSARSPTSAARPVLRAGLTAVLVTRMLTIQGCHVTNPILWDYNPTK